MRVRFAGNWVADSEDVILLHEPGRYPVAYFRLQDIVTDTLEPSDHVTNHRDLGETSWFTVQAGDQRASRAAWQHTALPKHASELSDRAAFAWRAMDSFFEEDERILGHAADAYHRIDIRQSSRRLRARHDGTVIADTSRPLVLYESGFAPRWYVPRADVDESALSPIELQTFCPYKGICGYYDLDGAHAAAWSYQQAFPEVQRISGYVSFEPDKLLVEIDGTQLRLAAGQIVISHGIERDLSVDEAMSRDP
jgi:uncharacterized protein (DUF427 family)